MFLKPFRVKKQNTLKGSDRKKLKGEIGKLFTISEDILSELFPTKGDMSVAKVELHNGDNVLVYSSQKNPIFFEINKKVYPTVYSLWKCPHMVPVFTTWPDVFKKLVDGADLMLPGVIVNSPVHMGTFRGIKKGDIASIRLTGNRSPVAVGETLLSGQDMYLSAMRGKGVKTIHIMGDLLWQLGDQSQPPPEGLDDNVEVEEDEDEDDVENEKDDDEDESDIPAVGKPTDDDNESDEDVEGAVANLPDDSDEGEESSEEDERDPKEAMDELLNYCCLCALKGKVTKSDLPLSTGLFFKNFLQPYCPQGQYVDIKKSSFKKLSKFLQTVEKRGLIRVRALSYGMDSIIHVDDSHEELTDLEVPELIVTTANSEDEFIPPTISDVFCVPSSLVPFFKSKSKTYRKSEGLSADYVRQRLTDYVKENNLQDEKDKSLIHLDPVLAEILLKKNENDMVSLRWEVAKSRLFEKMQPSIQIAYHGRAAIIKKGKIDPIKVDVVKRAGNKKVTLIDNVETFGLDPDKLAHIIQVKKACSTTVNPSLQKNRGMQIMAQGNQVDFIHDLLIEKYKLPIRFVQGLEKGTTGKKKKKR